MTTVYDVTAWTIPGSPSTTCYTDVGAVMNSIIADIHSQQTTATTRPGAVIYIPPGHYPLKTRVTIDVSFLTIRGSNHGFTSLSIRDNSNTSGWYETAAGGSHIQVQNTDGNAEAFYVNRGGNPRLSSVQFENFCIDGLAFTSLNSYTNGKVGIRFASANDSCRVHEMGFVYLEHALINTNCDAFSVANSFIAECGNCVELLSSGQASKICDNLIGAGPYGFSIYAENAFGILIEGNNIFPRGKDLVHLKACDHCIVASNRLHAFYPGMVTLEGACSEIAITGNHLYRQPETYAPFQSVNNGLDDLFGLIQLNGNSNSVIGNHLSYNVPSGSVKPAGATPTMILVKSGNDNYVATNHTVSPTTVNTVVLDGSTTNTHILDSGTAAQLVAYSSSYGFRATP